MQSGGTGMLDGRDVVVAVHEATGTDLAAKGAAYAEDQTVSVEDVPRVEEG